MKKKICNTISLILSFISILFIAWVAISWLDVVIHNTTAGYEYSSLNFFTWLIESAKNTGGCV